MRRLALGGKTHALADAEAVLLIHHHQRQLVERHRLLEQRMRAHYQRDIAGGDAVLHFHLLGFFHFAREQRHGHMQCIGIGFQRGVMLARQQVCRRHQAGLLSGRRHLRHQREGENGFAAAHIALQQPHHALAAFHILHQRVEQRGLAGGEGERQRPHQRFMRGHIERQRRGFLPLLQAT